MSQKVFEIVTNRIIDQLEQGVIPWRKPWKNSRPPCNLLSGKPYRGINALVCFLTTFKEGFSSPFWLTFKQAKRLGGSVKKGEKGTPIVFWKWINGTDKDTGREKTFPCVRYYTAFNLDQCENIPESKIPQDKGLDFKPIEQAEKLVSEWLGKPEIRHSGNMACYSPALDFINLPDPNRFKSVEGYYSTLFHELTHSTGHPNRLGRFEQNAVNGFGSDSYSKEELIAEIGAALLCMQCGIDSADLHQNQAAYVQNWLRALKDDRRLLVNAGQAAQKAVDLINGTKHKKGPSNE